MDVDVTATQLNPFAINLHLLAASAFNAAGDSARCLEHGRNAAELYPDNITAQLTLLGIHAYVQPDPELLESARRLQPASAGWAFAESALAYVFARCGEGTGARDLFTTSQQRPASERINFAAAWHTLGEASQAMDCLLEAASEGCGHLPLLLNLAENRALHQEPRMVAVQAAIANASVVRASC